MATIAVGDLHGRRDLLDALLAQLLPELSPTDTLVFLGDYVDRGPDSRGCLERLVALQAAPPCRLELLLGNHEQWLLRTIDDPTRHSWVLGMHGLTTVESYAPSAAEALRSAMQELGPRLVTERVPLPYEGFLRALPPSHLELLRGLRGFAQTDDALCVHAGFDPGQPVGEQSLHTLVWGAPGFPQDYRASPPAVYGHHNDAVLEGATVAPRIWNEGRAYGIDTVAHDVLTALRLPDERVFQARV